jgi:hypothetical protein
VSMHTAYLFGGQQYPVGHGHTHGR